MSPRKHPVKIQPIVLLISIDNPGHCDAHDLFLHKTYYIYIRVCGFEAPTPRIQCNDNDVMDILI